MLTRSQIDRFVTNLEAHHETLKGYLTRLREHQPHCEAVRGLARSLQHLDAATESVYVQINPPKE